MKALIMNILIPVIVALLPYKITLITMSQELYTREQVKAIILDIDATIDDLKKIDTFIDKYQPVTEYVPVSEFKLTCSTDGCDEVPFIALCIQHYNEVIQKNVAEEKLHEDQIIEPIA